MRRWGPAIALAAPLAAAAAFLAALAISERAGRPFAAIEPPRNGAEAAALGNAAALVRFLEAGEDLLRVYPIRPEAVSSSVPFATTLEAAVLSRRPEMLMVLEHSGALRDPKVRASLACLAADLGLADMIALLAPPATRDCVPGAAVRQIAERAAGPEGP